MFSKKHYEAIAELLAIAKEKRWTTEEIIESFSIHLEADNPAFDRERFLRACGPEG